MQKMHIANSVSHQIKELIAIKMATDRTRISLFSDINIP